MRAPALVILGTDTLAAARPATAVQLAHAAMAAGFALAIPVAWGDELVASAAMRGLRERTNPSSDGGPVILASCPRVVERLAQGGGELESLTISIVSPPVAAAMYLRELLPQPVHITFAGGCADESDGAIDERVSAAEFLARLDSQGVKPTQQPEFFESVLPPDRRRHWSVPGGAPTAAALAEADFSLGEVEVDQFAISLAQHLLSRGRVMIDPAPALGCLCAGEGCGLGAAGRARAAVESEEPPRSSTPVVDEGVCVELGRSSRRGSEIPPGSDAKPAARRPLAAVI